LPSSAESFLSTRPYDCEHRGLGNTLPLVKPCQQPAIAIRTYSIDNVQRLAFLWGRFLLCSVDRETTKGNLPPKKCLVGTVLRGITIARDWMSWFVRGVLSLEEDSYMFRMFQSAIFCGLLLILGFGNVPLCAQVTSGTIFGSVKDVSGAAVPNASITVHNVEIGVTRAATSSASGDFVVPNLPPATYSITVDAPGFKKLEAKSVVLSAADKLNAGDLVLQVGTVAETVNVTADAGQLQLQSNSGERSDVITSKQLNDVALNGRMILDYMKLIPGVVSSFDGSVATTWGIGALNINGVRANENEYTIDGSSNVDTGNNGTTHVTLNPDAVSEMKVLTSNYQAEFGKAAGGQIAVTTKGGTNQFHGNVRFFHRNEGMNANGWFNNLNDTPVPLYRYNYFGYQVGGPVWKNKVFFFWGQEYYRQLVPDVNIDQFRVPTALERQGDFSQSVDGQGNLLTIYDPSTGQPYPGNKIDPSTLSASQQAVFQDVQKLLSLYPLPNVTGSFNYNYATTLSSNDPRREDILRLDYQINSKNRFYGRWVNNANTSQFPMLTYQLTCMGQLQITGGCTAKAPSWNLSVNLVTTISPTLLNEVSIGPSWVRGDVEGTNGNLQVGRNNINLPMLFSVSPSTSIPDMGFSGNQDIAFPWSYFGANPWFQANTTINFNDNVTKVLNKHTFKFGVFYQRNRKDQISWGNSNGQFSFNNCPTSDSPSNCTNASQTTGMAYASALLGAFSSFSQSSTRPVGHFRYNQLEFYGQDTWRITPRLTLDYGMRFAWIPPQWDKSNQVAIFNPSLYDPAKAVRLYTPAAGGGVYDPASPGTTIPDPNGVLLGTIVPGSGDLLNGMAFANKGYPRGGWTDSGVIPEPRLGFAYALTNDRKTVLRGGYGTSHDRMQGNLVFNPVFANPANVQTPIVYNNNIANLPNLQSSGIVSPLSNIVGAQKDGKVPAIYSFSLGVQRELGRGTTLDIAYVGTLGRHLVTARNINQVPYLTTFTQAAQDPSKYAGGVIPAVEPGLPTQVAQAGFNYAGDLAFDPEFLVPFKGYGNSLEYYKFDGTSNYHSLQVSLQRRFSKQLTLGAVYTYSKALTTASADEDFQDTFLPRKLDYRLASFDVPHNLAVSYVYDVPGLTKHFGGPKWLSYVTDNFQFSGITQFQSGLPIDSGIWWPPANTINGTYNVWWIGYQRAWIYPLVTGDVNKHVGTSKFNPAAFQPPNLGIPVAASRSNLRDGGMQNWDMSIFKNIPLGSNEQRMLQLRLEAFNVFNHPNFRGANLNWWMNPPSGTTPAQMVFATRGSPDCAADTKMGSCFGEYTQQYSGVGGPRVLQLAAKFYF
jgi:carboxypeptidase family protein/TonB-dependent receptor-like protein